MHSWTLEFEPPASLSAWALGLLVAAACLIALLAGRQGLRHVTRSGRWTILSLRMASVVLLALILCRVTAVHSRDTKPVLALAVDSSLSMATIDEYDASIRRKLAELLPALKGGRRIDLVQSLLADDRLDWLARLETKYKVEFYYFAEGLRGETADKSTSYSGDRSSAPTIPPPNGRRTDLNSSLLQLLDHYRGAPPAAIVLFTDGNSTSGPGSQLSAAATQAGRQGIPLYVVGVGNPQQVRDLSVTSVIADAVGIVGDAHSFRVALQATRVPLGQGQVMLTRLGSPDVLDTAEVTFQANERNYAVELRHTPEVPGPVEYEVVVRPASGESNLQNNRAQVKVWVRESRLKLLIVERLPRWEFRHLKEVLERDAAVEIAVWLQDADPSYAREDGTALSQLPANLEQLNEFDAVLWGDVDPAHVPAGLLDALPEFVASLGGGLLLLPGEEFPGPPPDRADWEPLWPFAEKRAQLVTRTQGSDASGPLQPTAEGRVHPLLELGSSGQVTPWEMLAGPYAAIDPGEPVPSSQTLLRWRSDGDVQPAQQAQPLIVAHRVGTGVIVVQLFDETWRWRAFQDGALFRAYWSQLARFLSKRKFVEEQPRLILRSDRAAYSQGDAARLLLQGSVPGLEETPPRVRVTVPGGTASDMDLVPAANVGAGWEGSIASLTEGRYAVELLSPRITQGQPSTGWLVTAADPERTYQPLNTADLRMAADRSRGRFHPLWDAGTLLEELPAGVTTGSGQQSRVPLWNRWATILLLSGLLILEWTLRKRFRVV